MLLCNAYPSCDFAAENIGEVEDHQESCEHMGTVPLVALIGAERRRWELPEPEEDPERLLQSMSRGPRADLVIYDEAARMTP